MSIYSESSAYLDASGKPNDHKVITIAGMVAPVKKWRRFEKQWHSALSEEGLSIFHMTDFACSEGEFKNWKGDKERRARFIARLVEIIRCNTNKILITSIEVDAWEAVNREYMLAETFYAAYPICGLSAIKFALAWAKQKRIKSPMTFMFEDGEDSSDQIGLKKLCQKHHGFTPQFVTKAEALPCQAADLIAWKNRIASTNALRLISNSQSEIDPEVLQLQVDKEFQSLNRVIVRPGERAIFNLDALLWTCAKSDVPNRLGVSPSLVPSGRRLPYMI